jgi:hypothetical protein
VNEIRRRRLSVTNRPGEVLTVCHVRAHDALPLRTTQIGHSRSISASASIPTIIPYGLTTNYLRLR